jgi:DNA-binding MarR family transcriptional regulator
MTTLRDRMKDPLSRLPGYVLRRASAAALADLNRRLEPLKLRHAEVAFLLLIGSSPGISQSEAGRTLDIQRANMAPFVARLRRRGLVDRTQVDGRSQALKLTSAGRSMLARARRIVAGFEASLLERVPEKMRPMVLPILMALWKGGVADEGGCC